MSTEDKLRKVLELTEAIEVRKALYDELETLTLELQAEGFAHALLGEIELTLVDNFSEKNVQWRMAAVRRFEIKVKAPGAARASERKAKKTKAGA